MNKQKIIKIGIVMAVILLAFLLFWFTFLYPRSTFQKNEALLEKAGKRYFQVNANYLPKEEGRVQSVTLETLAKQKYVEDVYIPYSKNLCDMQKSTVRLVKKKGQNHFYTYLKCGKYESKTDHTGPVITLNGKQKMSLNVGESYQEPGIKRVVDDVDGNISPKKVTIQGTVDSNTIGTYQISYTVTDSLNNKTVVVRTVKVQESLAKRVKESAPDGYFAGNVEDNYVLFNRLLFRIVRVNSDGTITMVSDDPLSNVDYTSSTGRFENSSLDKWLNEYFYQLLEEENQKLLVNTAWCDDILTKETMTTTECSRTSKKRKVGLLSLQDYYRSLVDGESYLELRNHTWYANFDKNKKPFAISSVYPGEEGEGSQEQHYLLNVRPALTLVKDIKILSGSGTQTDPYVLVKETSGKKNELINRRKLGEYISYSGYNFRIIGKEEDDTTQIVMTDTLKDGSGTSPEIRYEEEGKEGYRQYNPKTKGNIGYQINHDMTKYIQSDLFKKRNITVPIYDKNITYEGKKTTQTYSVKLSAPSTFQIFSAKGKNTTGSGFWYLDSSKQKNTKAFVFPLGTTPLGEANDGRSAGVKIRAYLKSDVYITGGNGTLSNPYTIAD